MRARLALALAAAALLLAGRTAEAADFARLVRGALHEIPSAGDPAVVVIPLEAVDGKSLDGAKASIRDAGAGNGTVEALLGGITPAMDPPLLRLTIKRALLERPVTYFVKVLLAGGPKGEDRQTLDLQLVQAEATLRPPGTLAIERTWWLPFVSVDRTPALLLVETSRNAGLGPLAVGPLEPIAGDARGVVGGLKFGEITPLGPGLSKEATYTLAGDFGLGTSKGAVRVSAPQLRSPLDVPVEVRTRIASLYILPIVALALWLGHALRIGLDRRLARRRAEVAAIDLQAAIARRVDASPDAAFGKALEAVRAELDARLREPDSDLGAATTSASAAVEVALAELAARRAAARALLTALNEALHPARTLPPAVATSLDAARQALAQAAATLATDDVGTAEADLDGAGAAREAVVRAARTWGAGVTRDLALLESAAGALPASVLADAGAASKALQTELDELAARGADGAAALAATEAAHARLGLVVELLSRGWLAEASRLLRALSARKRAAPGSFAAAVSRLQGGLDAARGEPSAMLAAIRAAGPKLSEEMDAAVRSGAEGLPADDRRKKIEELLAARRYADAATELPVTERLLGAVPGGAGPLESADIAPPAPAQLATGAAFAVPVVTRAVARFPPPPPTREGALADIRRTLRRQNVISGVLLATAAWFLFGADFGAKWMDVVQVFGWAFGLNVGVQAVTELFKQGKAPA